MAIERYYFVVLLFNLMNDADVFTAKKWMKLLLLHENKESLIK